MAFAESLYKWLILILFTFIFFIIIIYLFLQNLRIFLCSSREQL